MRDLLTRVRFGRKKAYRAFAKCLPFWKITSIAVFVATYYGIWCTQRLSDETLPGKLFSPIYVFTRIFQLWDNDAPTTRTPFSARSNTPERENLFATQRQDRSHVKERCFHHTKYIELVSLPHHTITFSHVLQPVEKDRLNKSPFGSSKRTKLPKSVILHPIPSRHPSTEAFSISASSCPTAERYFFQLQQRNSGEGASVDSSHNPSVGAQSYSSCVGMRGTSYYYYWSFYPGKGGGAK